MKDKQVDEAYLSEWYIHSVDNTGPIWTDEHIKELCKDFDIFLKNEES